MKFWGKGDGHKSTTGKDYHTALHCGYRVKDSVLKDSLEHHMVIVAAWNVRTTCGNNPK